MNNKKYKYDAFISYSHAHDFDFVVQLQRDLQGYARPWNQLRTFHIFRDTTNLSAKPQLWPKILKALGQAKFLMILASPMAAESEWVRKEITWWLQNRDSDSMLFLLSAGTIEWDEDNKRCDSAKTESLPLDENLEVFLAQHYPDKPHIYDVKKFRNAKNLSLKINQYNDFVATLAGTLHPTKEKSDLFSEELLQLKKSKRRRRYVIIGLLGLLAIAATLGGVAYYQNTKLLTRLEQLDVNMAFRSALSIDPRERTWESFGYEIGPKWFGIPTKRTQSVVIISDSKTGKPLGSGFVIDGGIFLDEWKGKFFVVTVSHLIRDSIDVKNLNLRIPGIYLDRAIEIDKVVWESPEEEADVAILKVVDKLPVGTQPITEIGKVSQSPHGFENNPELAILGFQESSGFTFAITRLFGSGNEAKVEIEKIIEAFVDLKKSPSSMDASARFFYPYVSERGSSGSPIFDAETGLLVGMQQMTLSQGATNYFNVGFDVNRIREKIRESKLSETE